MGDIVVFSGSAHLELAARDLSDLGVAAAAANITRFSNDCLEVQLRANCRERDVFIVQPLVAPVQEHLVELLLMLDAARGASAARITAVIPHYAYARSDKKDAPRISIGGRLVADLLATAGANRVLTMALHAPQVHGFFSVPIDHLNALNELATHFTDRPLNTVVVSPTWATPNLRRVRAAARRPGRGRQQAAPQRRQGRHRRHRRRCRRQGRDRPGRRDRQRRHRRRAARPSPRAHACSVAWPARTGFSPARPSSAFRAATISPRSSPPTRCPAGHYGLPNLRCAPSPRCSPRRSAVSTDGESVSSLLSDVVTTG